MAAGVHHQVASHSSETSTSSGAANKASAARSTVAIRIEPSEKTPLLGKKVTFQENPKPSKCSALADFKVLLIGLFLAISLTIATYLLIIDNRPPPFGIAFDLVNRDAWSAVPYALTAGGVLKSLDVTNILFTQSGGPECYDMESCIPLLRNLEALFRSKNSEIPYNFMISGDGQIYEGKGWSYLSGFPFMPQETSMVVSFIGNFTTWEPSQEQLDAGKALIAEALRRAKLRPDFKLFGMQNLTISHADGSALYEIISRWPHFDTVLKVL